MSDLMGCGHPVSAVVSSDEGTSYCGKCVRESGQERTVDEERAREQARQYVQEESLEATHEWIREFAGDHAYAHGLADDIDLFARALLTALSQLDEAREERERLGGSLLRDWLHGRGARRSGIRQALDEIAPVDSGGDAQCELCGANRATEEQHTCFTGRALEALDAALQRSSS